MQLTSCPARNPVKTTCKPFDRTEAAPHTLNLISHSSLSGFKPAALTSTKQRSCTCLYIIISPSGTPNTDLSAAKLLCSSDVNGTGQAAEGGVKWVGRTSGRWVTTKSCAVLCPARKQARRSTLTASSAESTCGHGTVTTNHYVKNFVRAQWAPDARMREITPVGSIPHSAPHEGCSLWRINCRSSACCFESIICLLQSLDAGPASRKLRNSP